jgi:hypothetical protein
LYLGQSAARLDGLSFFLYRRFLIGSAKLQLFEQTAFGKFVLENLQSLFDVIVKYFDFQFIPPPSIVYFIPILNQSAICVGIVIGSSTYVKYACVASSLPP